MEFDIFETQRNQAEVLSNGLKCLVTHRDGKKSHLMMWQPRAKKPFYNFLINANEVESTITSHAQRLDYWEQQKAERKEINKVTPEKLETVKAGDIFRCSWGWEQTNVDFYKVISRKGRKVIVRQIGANIVSTDSWASGKKVPSDNFIDEEKTFTLHFSGSDPHFKMSDFETASRWNGQPSFYSEWA